MHPQKCIARRFAVIHFFSVLFEFKRVKFANALQTKAQKCRNVYHDRPTTTTIRHPFHVGSMFLEGKGPKGDLLHESSYLSVDPANPEQETKGHSSFTKSNRFHRPSSTTKLFTKRTRNRYNTTMMFLFYFLITIINSIQLPHHVDTRLPIWSETPAASPLDAATSEPALSSFATPLTTAMQTTASFFALTASFNALMNEANNLFRSEVERNNRNNNNNNNIINNNNKRKWTYALAVMIDPRFKEYSPTAPVDPCNISKYVLGFPHGLFLDRFLQTSHVPVCFPSTKTTCATFLSSPIQFLHNLIYNGDENAEVNSLIQRRELDEAIERWVADEIDLMKAAFNPSRIVFAVGDIILKCFLCGCLVFWLINLEANKIFMFLKSSIRQLLGWGAYTSYCLRLQREEQTGFVFRTPSVRLSAQGHIPAGQSNILTTLDNKDQYIFIAEAFTGRPCSDFYDFGAILGQGGFGQVYKAIHKRTKHTCAVKVINTADLDRDGIALHRNEITMMQLVQSGPFIVRLCAVFEAPTHTYLVMEECLGGSLADRVREQGKYSELEARALCRNLFEALGYIHRLRIAHLDVKPENILLMTRANNTAIKISDFGLSSLVDQPNSLQDFGGTHPYIAPEVWGIHPAVRGLYPSPGYDQRADMWSAGVLVFVLLSGCYPFGGEIASAVCHICHGNFEFSDQQWSTISDEAKAAIRNLLQTDVDQRYTADRVLECPWMTMAESDLVTDFDANPIALPADCRRKREWHELQCRSSNIKHSTKRRRVQ
jgi:serine/threonine protein kinase